VSVIIKEIQAKTILTHMKNPSSWFGVNYNMNIYRGCQHGCIYCDSRSLCYRIENFDDVLIKSNSLDILEKELASKRKKGIIGTGSMSDPYTPAEMKYNLTGRALELISYYGFSVHIVTKSDLILKDIETLKKINRVHASVALTITTTDDDLSKKIEPRAPGSSRRFEVMKVLSEAEIYTGVTMMPILPFIEDDESNITSIVKKTYECGGKYIIPCFGMSLRDRQREYYYNELDKLFPGLRAKYEKAYGDSYWCTSKKVKILKKVFYEECSKYGLETDMRKINVDDKNEKFEQMSLF
jgi:DNA repair photolyase